MIFKIIIFAIVSLVIFFITLHYMKNQAKKQGLIIEKENGVKARRIIGKKLKRIAFFKRWKIVDRVSLKVKNNIITVDYIVLASFGILTIMVRGDKGEIYADSNNPNWLHVNGPKREYIPNMITQSNIIKDELRRIFSAEKIYKVPIYSLVVFTEPKLELYSSSGGSVIHNKKLGKEFKKPCYKVEIDISMGKILSAIEKYKN